MFGVPAGRRLHFRTQRWARQLLFATGKASGGFAHDHPLDDGHRCMAGCHIDDGRRYGRRAGCNVVRGHAAAAAVAAGRCGAGRSQARRSRRDRRPQAGHGFLVGDAAREQPAIVAAALRMFAALQPAAERQLALAYFVVVQALSG